MSKDKDNKHDFEFMKAVQTVQDQLNEAQKIVRCSEGPGDFVYSCNDQEVFRVIGLNGKIRIMGSKEEIDLCYLKRGDKINSIIIQGLVVFNIIAWCLLIAYLVVK